MLRGLSASTVLGKMSRTAGATLQSLHVIICDVRCAL